MKFPTNILLTTPRLQLRLFRSSDLYDFNDYASVKGVGEMAGWKHHQSLDESLVVLSRFIEEKNVLALIDTSTNKVIGSIGIHPANFNTQEFLNTRVTEIGYVLNKDFWGQGFVVEAIKALLDYLFNVADFEIVTVAHFIDNIQSKRVIEKSGFVYHSDDIYYAKDLDKSFIERKYILTKDSYNKI